jgi:hypothetical protein
MSVSQLCVTAGFICCFGTSGSLDGIILVSCMNFQDLCPVGVGSILYRSVGSSGFRCLNRCIFLKPFKVFLDVSEW